MRWVLPWLVGCGAGPVADKGESGTPPAAEDSDTDPVVSPDETGTPPAADTLESATVSTADTSAPVGTGDTGIGETADTAAPPDPTDPNACNGSESWCDRPYNAFTTVCSHNAMSNAEDGFILPTPNQAGSFTAQLDEGVRCLMLDTYAHDGDLYLCHGSCGFWGERRLVDGLTEIADWMEAHPRHVVTFILEAYITEAETLDALTAAGLAGLLYHHGAPPGTPWPNLGEMIDGDARLVVFTDDAAANGDWHLNWSAYGWETPFDDDTFTCADGRGDPDRPEQIFILNHYTLCPLGGCEENALVNNAYDFLLDRAGRCWADAGNNPHQQVPTFLNLDHVHVPVAGGPDAGRADAFEVAEAINAAWPDPGALP